MKTIERDRCRICGLGKADHGKGWARAKRDVPGLVDVKEHPFSLEKKSPTPSSTVETQNAHTPLPWHRWGVVSIEGNDGTQVGSIKGRNAEESYANAELIVKAVNNFEPLIHGIETAYTLLNQLRDHPDVADDLINDARCALARALEPLYSRNAPSVSVGTKSDGGSFNPKPFPVSVEPGSDAASS